MKITGYRTYLAGLIATVIPFLEWITNNDFYIYSEDFTKSLQVASGIAVFLFRYLANPIDTPKSK